ncbi:hypothetical protein GCM10011490_06580 [Pseudoclavibacter endophyticus]|uniref:septum formation family protein n=1 Tax=Pseudoclavibacter endophyticus TaxID=1778590 RepID=UPI00166F414C|nr:septum formation family protein [Pseudoclavibacter endophyticus]GGA59275.1 hypothetical protein GCM10011490_06580 [Pseudoclavibacter endophyticus]
MPRPLSGPLFAVLGAAVLLTGCSGAVGDGGPSPDGTPITAGPDDGVPTNFLDLRVGDCFDIPTNLADGEALRYSSCQVLHMFEAYAETELPAGDFPGQDQLDADAAAFCEPAFVEYVGESWTTSDFDFQFIVPSERTWNELDDRKIMCMATSLSGLPWSGSSANGGESGA